MIQINAAARQPPKVGYGIKTDSRIRPTRSAPPFTML
jgi:hypothetical protein